MFYITQVIGLHSHRPSAICCVYSVCCISIQVIGLPSQTLGYVLCVYINALHVDVTAEIELKDIGAESKVALEDLCKKAVDFSLKNGAFQHVQLTQASALIGANDVSWRKLDLAK